MDGRKVSGFVDMSTPQEAAEAIQQFNGKVVSGRAMLVKEAQPK